MCVVATFELLGLHTTLPYPHSVAYTEVGHKDIQYAKIFFSKNGIAKLGS